MNYILQALKKCGCAKEKDDSARLDSFLTSGVRGELQIIACKRLEVRCLGHGKGEGETRWKSKSKEDFKNSCWVRSPDEVVEEDVDEGEHCEEESK